MVSPLHPAMSVLFEKSASVIHEPLFPPLFPLVSQELHGLLQINEEMLYAVSVNVVFS